jgi:hypothetical protein
MGQIMIKCPKTKKPLSTGMSMPRESFEDPSSVFNDNQVKRPHCNEFHTWQKRDAYVQDEKK